MTSEPLDCRGGMGRAFGPTAPSPSAANFTDAAGLIRLFPAAVASLPPLLPGDEIYDLKNPVAVPIPWLTWVGQGLLLLACLYGLGKLLIWLLTPGPLAKAPPAPPPDPLKEALAALARLKRSPVWEEGRIKDICEALTTILKAYLRDKFRLGLGPASTTTELLAELRTHQVRPDCADRVRELMELCDGIKFARGNLGGSTLESLFHNTSELIERGEWRR